MKKTIVLIFTMISLASMQSCQYEWLDPIDPDLPDIVSYSANIQPIWDRSCNNAACHAKGGFSPDLTAADSYNALFADNLINIDAPASSRLYTKCAPGGSMYKYCMPGDPEMILLWISQGALNN